MRKIDAFSRCIKIWFSIYWSRPKIGLPIGFFWVAYFCFADICKEGNLQTAIIKNECPKSRKFVDCRRKFEDSPCFSTVLFYLELLGIERISLCCVLLQGYFFTKTRIFTFMRCCEQQEISACCVAKLHLICI